MFKNITKQIYTWIGRPYLNVNISYNPKGLGISATYNQHFIQELDFNYGESKNTAYNPMLEDNVKVAFYLADGFDSILGRYEQSLDRNALPEDDDDDGYDDPLRGVPNLRGNPIRDVIDIAQMKRAGSSS
jgi:hypothetical protein